MQFWVILSLDSGARAFRMLIFCPFFFISWILDDLWIILSFDWRCALCCAKILLLRLCFPCFNCLLHFSGLFSSWEGKKEHLVFGDFADFSLEEICKNTFQKFCSAANTWEKLNAVENKTFMSVRLSREFCTEKNSNKVQLLKRQRCLPKWLFVSIYTDSSFPGAQVPKVLSCWQQVNAENWGSRVEQAGTRNVGKLAWGKFLIFTSASLSFLLFSI